jgi:hypothetical protein
MRGRLIAGLLALTVLAATIGWSLSPASAGAAPVFAVMNTSETPPDGVWFRNSPHTANTDRVTGHGVYRGERVQLSCYAWGDAVGAYHNRLWYQVTNVTRPRGGANGRVNAGYLNAHYVDDGMLANQVAPGVPPCDATPAQPPQPPAPTPGGASVYYSPFNDDRIYWWMPWKRVPSPASLTLYRSAWSLGTCSGARAGDFPDEVGGRRVTTLAGWSIGRMGPIFFLRDYPTRRSNINYVLLFDPGTYDELSGDCGHGSISQVLANWLSANPDNRLVILAGETTRDEGSRNGPYAHRGIQEVYFGEIRGRRIRDQVTVCNYDQMGHRDVWVQFRHLVDQAPITTSCPTAPNGTQPNDIWRP